MNSWICILLIACTSLACATHSAPKAEYPSGYRPRSDEIDLSRSARLKSKGHLESQFQEKTHIGLYFQINLGKYNHYSKSAARQISLQQSPLRQCYTKFHNIYQKSKKSARYRLIIQPSGRVTNVLFTGGTLKHIGALRCLRSQIARMPLRLASRNRISADLSLFFSTTPQN